ncbi:c-type cytochrome [Modicisalibacter tunisiensis]|uniref:Cytochrome c n=1 Tax=Modicisalibacter tunisiensis TaxID=390637 RepID=A0ABS7X0Q8_9GAMM|nr:cytochrome c [Modicisalibacter tunisiensis]MBZ9538116.1 cytochrome c [Modicisalibacter tunisiensis]MBZ9568474.1 cytochrome c [Modicisalibacter tunisiensis]
MKGLRILWPVLGLVGLPATAGADPIDDAIIYRQSAMEVMAWQLQPMADMARGETPYDAETFAERARHLEALAPLPWEGFIEGSYSRGGTAASATIAAQPEDFRGKAEAFEQAVRALTQAAGDGSFDAARAALVDVARSCKACHDAYRE